MPALYDKYYQKRDYFGKPYPELIEFFSSLPKKLKVLDIGCGQGRDVLSIGRMGFEVIGIDISKVGIEQLNEIAEKEHLNVKGIVADFYDANYKDYDVILLDSILHFYKNDIETETKLVNHIINNMKHNAVFITFMQAHKKREDILKNLFHNSVYTFTTLKDKHIIYEEFNGKYLMYTQRKEDKKK